MLFWQFICEKYWPDEGEVNKYEVLSVENTEEEMYGPQCTMRTLELTKVVYDVVGDVLLLYCCLTKSKTKPKRNKAVTATVTLYILEQLAWNIWNNT